MRLFGYPTLSVFKRKKLKLKRLNTLLKFHRNFHRKYIAELRFESSSL
jgi:hypothetical protein